MRMAWLGVALVGFAGTVNAETIHIDIDAAKDAKPISRYIYGVNQSLEGPYANLAFTRAGGNRWTCYNWTTNASNAGSDWQFQNDGLMGKEDTPGLAILPGLKNAAARNAALLITMPMAGYVSADKKGDGDVRKSGANYLQTRFKPMLPKKGAAFTLTPDPKSPNVYADEFVNWVMATAPQAKNPDCPIWWAMDNEPDLWSGTHAQVHPKPAGYDELVKLTVDYSQAIKAVAPKTLIFGPVNYGWMGFVRLQNAPDANNRDFQEYYLQKMAEAEKTTGKRLLDVLDVHWYPEARGGGVRIVDANSNPPVVAARLQAPRSLWDPTYTEDSWISKDVLHGPIKMLPYLQAKIDKNYKGTKLAVTEYNYGGGGHISGGIAEADVLGIFGREGVFAAAMWSMAKDESYIAGGFRMFRDFDGKGGSFGDTSVSASTDKVEVSSVYASTDSANPKRMVLVLLNKTDHSLTAEVQLKGRAAASAVAYVLSEGSAAPKPGKTVKLGDGKMEYEMPAYSVTTVEVSGK